MKEVINKVPGAGPYTNVLSWEGLLMALDERFNFDLTRTELAFLGVACAFGFHAVIKYGAPIAKSLYRKLLALTGAAVVLFAVSTAHASEARLVADCAKYKMAIDPESSATEPVPTEECERERVYFDLGIRFGGLAFRLNRPREILAGFDAGVGYGLRWRPDWWSFTPSFVSLDLYLSGGYVAREDIEDAVSVGCLLVLSLFDWFGIGGGIQHAFGLGSSSDYTTWIGTVGIAKGV